MFLIFRGGNKPIRFGLAWIHWRVAYLRDAKFFWSIFTNIGSLQDRI